MKILHTGDWHIGHVLYGYDRACDHAAMLQSLCNVVAAEQPDVMVVSGDIFHTGQPSSAAQNLMQRYLVEMSAKNANMIIIATAGNHDSPSRHEALVDVWHASRVEMVGTVKCNANEDITSDALDRMIFPIADKGFVVAMPYVHQRNIPDDFYQQLLDRVAERNADNLPVVMMAHLAVGGVDYSGHEVREDSDTQVIGGLDVVPLAQLGSGYDYLALGHIHHAQFVPGSDGKARYAGSPLPISFDEAYAHSVSIVEIAAHGVKPEVRTVNIDGGRQLITLCGEKGMYWDDAVSNLEFMLADQDLPKGSLIRVNVRLKPGEMLPTEAEAVVRKAVTDAGQLYCRLNIVREDVTRAISDRDLNADELRKIPPITLAKRYAADIDVAFTPEMEAMFNEIVNLVNSQQDED
jgi:exonuclease SbcD